MVILFFFRKNLPDITELREEILGKEENLKALQIKMASQALIQRFARSAVNIFIENPRSKVVRVRIMEEFQMELLSLDKFKENGRIVERGLFNFLANGELKQFPFNFSDIKSQNEISKLNGDSSSSHKYKPYDLAGSVFNNLTFSPPSERLPQVQQEIEEDINEFLNCMKNSVFYSSGIHRYFGSELDKIKRAFIELQTDKHKWMQYFEKHIYKKEQIICHLEDTECNRNQILLKKIKDINIVFKKLWS